MTEDLEEAQINAYMEAVNANGEGPTDAERLAYLKARLFQVQAEYKALVLQRHEVEARKNEELLNKITSSFRENWKARKYVVTELRKCGETVEDKFIPKCV